MNLEEIINYSFLIFFTYWHSWFLYFSNTILY